MRKNELMLNDWVSVIENDEKNEGICRIAELHDDTVLVKYPGGESELVGYNQIFPIDTTLERIKESGVFYPLNPKVIMCSDSNLCIANITDDTETYGDIFHIGRENFDVESQEYLITDNEDRLKHFAKFSNFAEYVHLVQNAMRAYGPDTAECADLFKMEKMK